MKLISPQVLEESVRTFQSVAASDLDWTVVRAPNLKDGPKQGGYHVGFTPPPPTPLAREDVAEFMLKQVSDKTYLRRAPMIGR